MTVNEEVKIVVSAVLNGIDDANTKINTLIKTAQEGGSTIRQSLQRGLSGAGGDLLTFGNIAQRTGTDVDAAFDKMERGTDGFGRKLEGVQKQSRAFSTELDRMTNAQREVERAAAELTRNASRLFDVEKQLNRAFREGADNVDALTLEYLQLSQAQKRLETDFDRTNSTLGRFKNSIGSIQGSFGKLAVAGAAITGALFTMKRALDFSEQGAGIRQIQGNFDSVTRGLNAPIDLLQQLREAANGAVDDLSLQQSVLTLLAGTTGEFGSELAAATPQLVAMADAAARLNPSLGSSSKLTQDLFTAVKRLSPQILDNLGIVVKVGDANKEYAAALGKSTEELTATEKQQAFLNAALAGGEVLLAQAGDAASAATAEYGELETGLKNLSDQFKIYLDSQIREGTGFIGESSKEINVTADALRAYNEDLITYRNLLGIIAQQADFDLFGGVDAAAAKLDALVNSAKALDSAIASSGGDYQRYVAVLNESGVFDALSFAQKDLINSFLEGADLAGTQQIALRNLLEETGLLTEAELALAFANTLVNESWNPTSIEAQAAASGNLTAATELLTTAELANVEAAVQAALATQELTAAQIESLTQSLALAAADGELTQAEIDLAIANATTEQTQTQKAIATLEAAKADLILQGANGELEASEVSLQTALLNTVIAAYQRADAIAAGNAAASADIALMQKYGSGVLPETTKQLQATTAAFDAQFNTIRGGSGGAGSALSEVDATAKEYAKTLRDDVVTALDTERAALEKQQAEYEKTAATLSGIVVKGFQDAEKAGEKFFELLANPDADPEALAEATKEILDNQFETVASLVASRRGDDIDALTQNLDLEIALGLIEPDEAAFRIQQRQYFDAVDKLFGEESLFLDSSGATVDIGELFLDQDNANEIISDLAKELQQTVDAGFGSEAVEVTDLATKLTLDGTIENDNIDEVIDGALDGIRGGLSAEEAIALELGGGDELLAKLEALSEQELVQNGAEERIEFLSNAAEMVKQVEGLAETVAAVGAISPHINISANTDETAIALEALGELLGEEPIVVPTELDIIDGATESLIEDITGRLSGVDESLMIPVGLILDEESESFEAFQEQINALVEEAYSITFDTNAAKILREINALQDGVDAVPERHSITFSTNARRIELEVDSLRRTAEQTDGDYLLTFNADLRPAELDLAQFRLEQESTPIELTAIVTNTTGGGGGTTGGGGGGGSTPPTTPGGVVGLAKGGLFDLTSAQNFLAGEAGNEILSAVPRDGSLRSRAIAQSTVDLLQSEILGNSTGTLPTIPAIPSISLSPQPANVSNVSSSSSTTIGSTGDTFIFQGATDTATQRSGAREFRRRLRGRG